MLKTTVQLEQKTLSRLKEHKQFERQTYDEVVNIVLDNMEDDTLTSEEIEDLRLALDEVKNDKIISLEDLSKEFGVKL